MKSNLLFPLLGAFTLVACGALTAACSSTGDTTDDPNTNASDLGTGGGGAADACDTARIICPNHSHCESTKGNPACVPDAPVKNGFGTQGDASTPPPVGFFPNDDAGRDSSVPPDGKCPSGEERCCTSSGFQCVGLGVSCTMLDSACEPAGPKVGFFPK